MCLGLGSLACCVTGQAASCLCAACPSCKNSTSARLMYALFMLMGSLLAMIMCTNGLEDALRKVPMLCKGSRDDSISEATAAIDNIIGTSTTSDGAIDCTRLVGFEAAYRVCFGMCCFFWLFMILMLGTRSSKDPRSGIQNGFWGIKFLILAGFITAAFFVPSEPFDQVMYVFGLIGGLAFILIQLVLFIDFAYRINAWAVQNMEDADDERDQKCWFAGLIFATFSIFVLTSVAIGYLFYYYGGNFTDTTNSCSLHKFFISFNMILCFIISVVSILPKVQEHNPASGLLQSAVVSAYVMFLTWSSMSNSPEIECNPSIASILNITDAGDPDPNTDPTQGISGFNAQSIVGLVLFFLAVLWSSLTNSSAGSGKPAEPDTVVMTDQSDPEGGTWDDEEDATQYNYSYLHFMFSLGTLYIMMTLTYWFNISQAAEASKDNNPLVIAGWAPVWVKMSSAWICIALYTWTMIAPAVLQDRDFGF